MPLWFVAETERNTFLWRQGFSLSDVERFEFWVDLPVLIEKRRKQLSGEFSNFELGGNPFIGSSSSEINNDSQYLEQLEHVVQEILGIAHALCLAASTARTELKIDRPKVVLPYRSMSR
jgi:hypothetical protein